MTRSALVRLGPSAAVPIPFFGLTLGLAALSSFAGLAGCASRSDNPFPSCVTTDDCDDGEICYRSFCIPDGVDAGIDAPMMDTGPIDGGVDTGADVIELPDAPDAPPPDGGCPRAGETCSTSMAGVCAAGTRTCLTPAGECTRDVDPSAEVCNTRDDDCDGSVDEDADPACYTGTSGCTENGDGTYTCQGICQAGTQVCGATGMLGSCVGEVLPLAGTDGCTAPGTDAVDDDCDGMIDEDCMCTAGEVRPCYSGPMGTAGVGRCVAGTITCSGGTFGACSGEVFPRAEDCTNPGEDDDCNGVDDDVPGTGVPCDTGRPGVCADGVMTCMGTAVACVGPTMTAETCNMLDDDCDGLVDENFDLATSEDHCGGCGVSCGSGRTCCGGTCVSTDSDPMHCGDCSGVCSPPAGSCCRGGCRTATAPECTGCPRDCSATGEVCCNGTCVDIQSDAANCGGCGAMDPGFVCASGDRCCAGTCVSDSDAHCGSCAACDTDEQCCGPTGGAACVLDADPMNCRGCGVVCGMGQTCCASGCANTMADRTNCGSCGTVCPGTQICSSGLCCPMGQYNSGGLCCPTGTYNSAGICCTIGLNNCGGTCFNLQNSEAHCGSCPNSCGGLEGCCGGSCQSVVVCPR